MDSKGKSMAAMVIAEARDKRAKRESAAGPSLSISSPDAGNDDQEVTSVTIKKAHGGFTVEAGGEGMYGGKPAVCKTAAEAASTAIELLTGKPTASAGRDAMSEGQGEGQGEGEEPDDDEEE